MIGILSLVSNASDWWMITFTPFSSDQMISHSNLAEPNLTSNRVIAADQMIRNLSMKIGEVDSG